MPDIMPLTLYPCKKVRDVYREVLKHVTAEQHKNVVCSDDMNQRLVGVECRDCSSWWSAPMPIAGQYTDWPDDLKKPNSAEGRREYLAKLVLMALEPERRTAWEHLLESAL